MISNSLRLVADHIYVFSNTSRDHMVRISRILEIISNLTVNL